MPTDYTNDFKYSLEFLLSKTETSDSWYNGSLIRDSFCFTRKKTKHRAVVKSISDTCPEIYIHSTQWCIPNTISPKNRWIIYYTRPFASLIWLDPVANLENRYYSVHFMDTETKFKEV